MARREQTKKDLRALKHFLAAYKHQYDLNSYARTAFDEDLEYYVGYRDETKYPLKYKMAFNKLLPRVQTILSRFMDQIYQTGTHNIVSVRPRKRNDVDRAPRVEGLLNFQLENLNSIDQDGGGYMFNKHWMSNAVIFGKGIAKLYWRREERIGPRRISMPIPRFDNTGRLVGMDSTSIVIETPQIVYNGPYAEVIHNKTFVPHPHYKDVQKMPNVFCVYRRSIDYLHKMEKKGIYRNVKHLGGAGSLGVGHSSGAMTSTNEDSAEAFAKSIEIEGVLSTADLTSEYISPEVDVIEGYGKYVFPEDETPINIGGPTIKGGESEAIVHIGNYKALLSIQKNKYGVRPFFCMGAYTHPELFWDLGIIRLGKGIQEQYANLGNTRYQNALMMVNQMLKVRMDADIDPQALVWKPSGLIPVEEMSDVEPLLIPDVSQSGIFREQMQFFEETLEEITGMYKYGMGATPSRQEHVGTIYSLQSMGEARTRLLLMTMDYMGFQPFLRHMMLLNTWHLPQEFETRIIDRGESQFVPMFSGDIHPEYDFTVRYTSMEPALGKQHRANQLIQYAQMWQQSPYLQHHQFMKAILEMLDFKDSERYLLSPEQVQAQQMQQMKQQTQMQLMAAATQDQLAAKASERALTKEIVKGVLK